MIDMLPPTLALLLLMAPGPIAPSPAQAPADPPRLSVVVVLADDLGPGDLGCYGGKIAPTPEIDRMAREGVRFDRYYSPAPICSPSRAATITGQYAGRWRITSFLQTRAGNRACDQADFLDPSAPSLPRAFRAAGYATGHFGKWHLGGGRDVVDPPKFAAYGVDAHAGTYESPEPDPKITATGWIFSDKDEVKRWDRSSYFVDRTLDFLKENKAKGRPSFVNLWLDDPHTPWIPDAASNKEPTRENLRGVLAEMDRQVGRLLEGLRSGGLADDTLVLFLSDNGPLPPFKVERTMGLRGSKLSLYEGGMRVPGIAWWPGHVPAGRVDDRTVISAIDLFPTLTALAHVPPPAGVTFDGVDRSRAILGEPIAERPAPLFFEYGRNDKSFAYPGIAANKSPEVAAIGEGGRWKVLAHPDGSGVELYDLIGDPGEQSNVADKNPEVARKLADAAVAWRKSLP